MNVAEIHVTLNSFNGAPTTMSVKFSSVEWAEREFATLKELVKRLDDRANDVPKRVEIVGEGSKLDVALKDVQSFGLVDYQKADEQQAGVRDAFPNLFKH